MTLAMMVFALAGMVKPGSVGDAQARVAAPSDLAAPGTAGASSRRPGVRDDELPKAGPPPPSLSLHLAMPGSLRAERLPRTGFAITTAGVEAHLDPRQRRGRLSLGDDSQGNLLLHFDWRTGLGAFGAYDVRIHPSVNLSLFGRWYRLAAPDIRVRPGATGGPDVQLALSLFEGRF